MPAAISTTQWWAESCRSTPPASASPVSSSTGRCVTWPRSASDFPVYARGVTHRGPYKDGPGEINVPISVGGMVVNPGDIVVGDQDGLLAIPQQGIEQLIEKARAHLEAEAQTMRAMKEGRWDRAFIDALEARCNN